MVPPQGLAGAQDRPYIVSSLLQICLTSQTFSLSFFRALSLSYSRSVAALSREGAIQLRCPQVYFYVIVERIPRNSPWEVWGSPGERKRGGGETRVALGAAQGQGAAGHWQSRNRQRFAGFTVVLKLSSDQAVPRPSLSGGALGGSPAPQRAAVMHECAVMGAGATHSAARPCWHAQGHASRAPPADSGPRERHVRRGKCSPDGSRTTAHCPHSGAGQDRALG